MRKLVSIIIVNWNGKQFLKDCLDSVLAQNFTDFEVILVDNGSHDGSVEYVRLLFPDVKIVELQENLGFSGGNNVGLKYSTGDLIVLLNNDTVVTRNWLDELVVGILADCKIAACDSKVFYEAQPDVIWSAGGCYSPAGSVRTRGFNVKDNATFDEQAEVFAAVACSAIYRKSTIDEIGFFDPDFFNGYEDIDWSFRARLRGYKIMNCPKSQVLHKVSMTQGHNSENFVYWGQRNIHYAFFKNMPSNLLRKYLPLHLMYSLSCTLYFYRINRLGAFLKAKNEVINNFSILKRKRAAIQKFKTVDSAEIERLLDNDWLIGKISKMQGIE